MCWLILAFSHTSSGTPKLLLRYRVGLWDSVPDHFSPVLSLFLYINFVWTVFAPPTSCWYQLHVSIYVHLGCCTARKWLLFLVFSRHKVRVALFDLIEPTSVCCPGTTYILWLKLNSCMHFACVLLSSICYVTSLYCRHEIVIIRRLPTADVIFLCYFYLSVHLSIHPSIHPSIYLFICLSVYHLSSHPPIYLSIYLPTHPSIYLSTHLSTHLFICLSIYCCTALCWTFAASQIPNPIQSR
jgi:hypothetical protein